MHRGGHSPAVFHLQCLGVFTAEPSTEFRVENQGGFDTISEFIMVPVGSNRCNSRRGRNAPSGYLMPTTVASRAFRYREDGTVQGRFGRRWVGSILTGILVFSATSNRVYSNTPPVVLLNQAHPPTVLLGVPIAINVVPYDTDGVVSKVELWLGDQKREERSVGASSASVDFTLSNLSSGDYVYHVIAEDDLGARASSATNQFHVTPPPQVHIAKPVSGQTFIAGVDSIEIEAIVQTEYGAPSEVQIYSNERWNFLGSVRQPPFRVQWSPATPGIVSLGAIVSVGLTLEAAISEPVVVTINPVGLPAIVPSIAQNRPVGGGVVTNHGTAQFMIQALSRTPLAYQWIHDGVVLPGATNDSLTITNVGTSDSGNYGVFVRNHAGTIRSEDAWLLVTGQTNPPGGGAIYFANRVPAMGIDAPIVTEDHGTNRITSTGYLVSLCVGDTPDKLTPLAVRSVILDGYIADSVVVADRKPGETVYATVRMRGNGALADHGESRILRLALGDASHPAYLIGLESFAPHAWDDNHFEVVPVTYDANRKVIVGGITSVAVSSTTVRWPPGTSPAPIFLPHEYQWRKDGLDIPGATNRQLTIEQAQGADAGRFAVMISDGYRAGEYPIFGLSVLAGPTLAPFITPSNQPVAFRVLSEPPMRCVVQSSTNLPEWADLVVLTNVSGQDLFMDTRNLQTPGKFYRVIAGP